MEPLITKADYTKLIKSLPRKRSHKEVKENITQAVGADGKVPENLECIVCK